MGTVDTLSVLVQAVVIKDFAIDEKSSLINNFI
jgi:hypothetical protein